MWWALLPVLLGAFLFGPAGAVLGLILALGYLAAKAAAGGLGGAAASRADAGAVFFRASFTVMGCVSKADGRVTAAEIHKAEEVMEHALGLSPEQRRTAQQHFRAGAQPEFDLDGMLAELAAACGREPDLIAVFMEIQVMAACADGEYSPAEDAVLQRCCRALGFPPATVAEMRALHLAGGPSAEADFGRPDAAAGGELARAYRLLEVAPSASDREVQRAYAGKMRKFHPDKLVSKGLPQEMMDFAADRTKDLAKAYQLVKQARRGAA